MPRDVVTIPGRIEKIEVLAPDGSVDKKLEPRIPEKDLLKLYRYMLFTRLLDERCLHMQRQGRIGTYGPCKGQEATPLGIAYHLKKEDWFVPTYRELPGYLWRGWPVERYMLWWGGHEIGSSVPEGINDTPICVPIASQVQYGAGIAWGSKLRKDGSVVACFCGDGGTSQGDFHEGLNFASVYKVPMVMVVQNNHWAISMPRHKQMASQTIAQKAVAYGMDAFIVDGNDILAVLVAAGEAIEKARKGGGPTLIEAITYRLSMHTTADDPKKYRSDEEVKSWEKKDPLPRFRLYLQNRKLLDDKIQTVMEEDIRKELDAGVAGYEKYRHDPYAMFQHMYAEMTPELQRQMAEFRAHMDGAESSKPVAAHAH